MKKHNFFENFTGSHLRYWSLQMAKNPVYDSTTFELKFSTSTFRPLLSVLSQTCVGTKFFPNKKQCFIKQDFFSFGCVTKTIAIYKLIFIELTLLKYLISVEYMFFVSCAFNPYEVKDTFSMKFLKVILGLKKNVLIWSAKHFSMAVLRQNLLPFRGLLSFENKFQNIFKAKLWTQVLQKENAFGKLSMAFFHNFLA